MTDKKEQQMKQDIASELRKKDYYDILCVSKSASEVQIKKAYRTLALRFHPDKNPYEGSKEVFKKVSNAYSVLSDPQKKQHYDRFGLEEDRPPPRYRNAGANGQDYEFNQADDIFNLFFGMQGMHGHQRGRRHQQFHTYSFGGQQNGQNAQQQQQGGFGFYYIFLIFFVVYAIAPLFQSKPNYSTIPSSEYRYKKVTSLLNVEFYVNQNYFEQAKSPNYKRQSEMIIDREYINQLERNCETAKKQKRRIEEYAYRQNAGPRRESYLAQARTVDMNTCRLINQIRYNHEDYIRDLTYMR